MGWVNVSTAPPYNKLATQLFNVLIKENLTPFIEIHAYQKGVYYC